jgi:threonine dehydratase
VEYSGAATVAALLDAPWAGGRTAAILSGGNIDPARLPELLAAL